MKDQNKDKELRKQIVLKNSLNNFEHKNQNKMKV